MSAQNIIAGCLVIAVLALLHKAMGAMEDDAAKALADCIDAEHFRWLDENLIDALFSPERGQWGLMTRQRRFLVSADSLAEAVAQARLILDSDALFEIRSAGL